MRMELFVNGRTFWKTKRCLQVTLLRRAASLGPLWGGGTGGAGQLPPSVPACPPPLFVPPSFPTCPMQDASLPRQWVSQPEAAPGVLSGRGDWVRVWGGRLTDGMLPSPSRALGGSGCIGHSWAQIRLLPFPTSHTLTSSLLIATRF
ncbi:hypothetical protein mRhiFer1_009601 [Rhinolophus ferrumequinum]|uniref:Uncharacterized protein n=1 Tax=Rhinolophus ferrumequinum TaxID=59479 RepID=A0A7J7ZRT0_RHIFE|nr:hypothetical protein mRhiFer1_009601 [Rhinolophus ferrumequinum]